MKECNLSQNQKVPEKSEEHKKQEDHKKYELKKQRTASTSHVSSTIESILNKVSNGRFTIYKDSSQHPLHSYISNNK